MLTQKEKKSSHSNEIIEQIGNDSVSESKAEEIIERAVSAYHKQYLSSFPPTDKFDINFHMHSLTEHRICYDEHNFCEQPNILFLTQSQNSKVLCLSVGISHFNFEISVINMATSSNSSQLASIGNGAFAKIYLYKQKLNDFAIKNIKYTYFQSSQNLQLYKNDLKEVIVQCCLTKLFSALHIGPAFVNLFGFDLVIYQDSAQFAIEKCKKVKQSMLKQLYYSLRIMHQLHIVHGDIKPQNIMFSKTYQKCVFIDFGLSKVVNENIGQLTQTKYFGTFYFTLPQMQFLFTFNQNGQVDLYYNDIHALKLTTKIFGKQDEVNQIKLKPNNNEYQSFVINLKLQYLIFRNELSQVKQFMRSNQVKQIHNETLYLFEELNFFGNQSKQIFQFIVEFFGIINTVSEKITKYFLGNNYQTYPFYFKSSEELFKNRISQYITCKNFPRNGMMYFYQIYQKKLASPLSNLKVVEEMREFIKNCQNYQHNDIFWLKFKYLVRNNGIQADDLIQLFNTVKKILKIQKWQFEIKNKNIPKRILKQNKSLYFLIMAKQIREEVWKQYQIQIFFFLRKKINLIQSSRIIKQNIQKFELFKTMSYFTVKMFQQILNIIDFNSQKNPLQILKSLNAYKQSHPQIIKDSGPFLLIKFFQLKIEFYESKLNIRKIEQYYNIFTRHNLYKKSNVAIDYIESLLDSYYNLYNNHNFDKFLKISYNYCLDYSKFLNLMAYELIIKDILYDPLSLNIKQFEKVMDYFQDITKIGMNYVQKYTISQKKIEDIINGITNRSFIKNEKALIKKLKQSNKNKKQSEQNQFSQNYLEKCIAYLIEKWIKMRQFQTKNVQYERYRINLLNVFYKIDENLYYELKKYYENTTFVMNELERVSLQMEKESMEVKKKQYTKFLYLKIEFEFRQNKISQIELCRKMLDIFELSWTNPDAFFYFYCLFYKIYIKNTIDPTLIGKKILGNNEEKLQYCLKIVYHKELFYHIHIYNQDLFRKDKITKQNYQSLCSSFQKKLFFRENQIINLQCIIISNIYFFCTGSSYGKINAIYFLIQKIQIIYSTFHDNSGNPNYEIITNYSNIILILDQLLVMVLWHQTYRIQEIEVIISSKIKLIFKFIFMVLPFCEPYYRNRFQVKYYQIISMLIKNNFGVKDLLIQKFKNNQIAVQKKLQKIRLKRFRNKQYLLKQQGIKKLLQKISKNMKTNISKIILFKIERLFQKITRKKKQKITHINYTGNIYIYNLKYLNFINQEKISAYPYKSQK